MALAVLETARAGVAKHWGVNHRCRDFSTLFPFLE